MSSLQRLTDLVKEARRAGEGRKFNQSFELILALQDIDVKKQGLSINEIVALPNRSSAQPKVCVFASRELAIRAKEGGADRVIEPDGLDGLATDRREAKKVGRGFSFFLAETSLMPKVGKILGQQLGPKGKMPAPVHPDASIENMISRLRSAVRVRGRGQPSLACGVGDEGMSDEQVAENVLAVISSVERGLPAGSRNLKSIALKLSMGRPIRIPAIEVK